MYQNHHNTKNWPVLLGSNFLPYRVLSFANQNGKSNIIPMQPQQTTILLGPKHLQMSLENVRCSSHQQEQNGMRAMHILQRYCWRRLVDVFLSLQLIPRCTSPNIYLDLQSIKKGASPKLKRKQRKTVCRPVFAVFWKATPSLSVVPAAVFVSQWTSESC